MVAARDGHETDETFVRLETETSRRHPWLQPMKRFLSAGAGIVFPLMEAGSSA